MALRYDTITFLSDYGLTDGFVGVVHSVIRSIAPEVAVIDLTHGIEPYDVRGGGLALARSAPYLCPGVVLAVIDPAVGTSRRPIAVEIGDGAAVLVGPDNGLLAPVVQLYGGATRAVEITNEIYMLPTDSATFDGRDIFAPVAAHLCMGVELTDLGPLVRDVDAANAALDALGYAKGADGIRVVPATADQAEHPMAYEVMLPGSVNFNIKRQFELVAEDMKQIGVELIMRPGGDATASFAYETGENCDATAGTGYEDFDMAMWNWVGSMTPAGRGIWVITLVRRDTAPPKGTANAKPSKACGCHHRHRAKTVNTIQVSPKMVQHDQS
jgi:hypothetical protein